MNSARPITAAGMALLTLALVLPGCKEFTKAKKFDNPVAGPAPTRKSFDNPAVARGNSEATPEKTAALPDKPGTASDLKLASATKTEAGQASADGLEPAPGGAVVVVVNGEPIFVDDVLDRMPPRAHQYLAEFRSRNTPAEYEAEKCRLVREFPGLRAIIERTVLVQALAESVKPDMLKSLNASLDKEFDKHCQQLMTDMEVSTKGELQVKLQEQGNSLDSLKESYRNEQMAGYYVALKSPKARKPDRPELLKYYEDHIKDYEYISEVRWQQIVLKYERDRGPKGTRKLADKICQELRDGADFDALVDKYSESTNKSNGGIWDWTKEGGMKNKEIEKQLFTMEIGGISEPMVNGDALEIVRVLNRKPAGRKEFPEVQDQILKTIMGEERKAAITNMIVTLMKGAEIEYQVPDAG